MKIDKTAECILQEKNINQSPVIGRLLKALCFEW